MAAPVAPLDPAPLPYQTPPGLPPGVTVIPMYPLYSPRQMSVASFFAGPIAGAVLLAINYRRLGQARKGIALAIAISVGFLGLLAIISALDVDVPRAVGVGVFFAMAALIRTSQSAIYQSHIARQGRTGSSWHAVGAAVLSAVVTFGSLAAVTIGVAAYKMGTLVEVGNCQGYYNAGATESETRAVCQQLIDIQFIQDRQVSIKVSRLADRPVVEIVLDRAAAAAHADEVTAAAHEIAEALSAKIYNHAPVDIWLIDDEMKLERKIDWASH
jgi:hypothetical protein